MVLVRMPSDLKSSSFIVLLVYNMLATMTQTQKEHKDWHDHVEALASFETKLLRALNDLGIVDICQGLAIDHACIRFSTNSQVDSLRQELKDLGQELSSAQVNGREIVIIQLHEALKIAHWQVRGLELPYPKKKHNFADGWEHVEFVLPYVENAIEALREEIMDMLPALDMMMLEQVFDYKESIPKAEGEQLANPTIALKARGIGIKFHVNPIQDIVTT